MYNHHTTSYGQIGAREIIKRLESKKIDTFKLISIHAATYSEFVMKIIQRIPYMTKFLN